MKKAYERLLEYVKYDTYSDRTSDTTPTTELQRDFGKVLLQEMLDLGIKDAKQDENGYVTGTIPSNIPNFDGPAIGFVSHMDVINDVPTANIKARIVENYDGGVITLNEEQGITMSPEDYPELKGAVGKDLIVTDGTTLLGGDDKCGIAASLTMAEYFLTHPEVPHCTIKIAFTPDEEIDRSIPKFNVKDFGADFAYTIDGGAFGDVCYETFNACTADIYFDGLNTHPGRAKDTMINAILLAMEFDAELPALERPQYTADREGFYHLTDFNGVVDKAYMRYILRDHDLGILESRKAYLLKLGEEMNKKYGEGRVRVELTDGYRNMGEKVKPHWHLIDIAFEAIKECGGTPVTSIVRGGTDGSRLSFRGLPAPNLGKGSYNAHGQFEYVVIQELEQTAEMMEKICIKYGEKSGLKNTEEQF